jgi:hypothetical protein
MTKRRLGRNTADMMKRVGERVYKAKLLLAQGKHKQTRVMLDEIGQLLCLFYDVHKRELTQS